MNKINILSSKIFNRIAAGEVVERPSSVVKELVENSIDAGAKNITIEINDGGVSFISILDDGVGILKNELKKALLPHATSKISKIDDLDAIATLGFRGEALASIASVSKITIKSKPAEQEIGALIYSEGGSECEVEDCGMGNGTEISVENLFFNAPVRAKFLKSYKSEESEITQTVARFILGQPEISFKYVANGKTILQSFGDGIESAFIAVYGVNTVKDCYFIDTEKNGISIKGYIGKQYFTKPNRTYQTVFLNGRYVSNSTISSAIGNAYSAYLMKRQYPFYVLNLTMPSEAVDVNVHPNKIDVRFMNNQIVYGSIYSVISKVLDGATEALSIITDTKTDNSQNNYIKPSEIKNDYVSQNTPNPFEDILFNDSAPALSHSKIELETKAENEKNSVDIFAENKAYIEQLEKKKLAETLEKEQTVIKVDEELNFIGQGLNTYLIYQIGGDLLFVDQHALHERIIFDKLMNKEMDEGLQPLLIPYVFTVNSIEFSYLSEKLSTLTDLGIEIEEFGENSFKISALPVFLSSMNLQKFFDSILEDIYALKSISKTELLKEKLAMKACKSAIKSGDKLTSGEINILTDYIKGNLALTCPHGRPVAIRITRTEIDKWFKRIV